MKDEHTYQELVQVARQIRANEALPPELRDADALLVFLWALATTNWQMAATLFEELLPLHPQMPPIWGGLLAHLIQLAPATEARGLSERSLPKLIELHLKLSEETDNIQEGLLSRKENSDNIPEICPLEQTFWIWSNQALIELGAATNIDVLPLILINEVSVFEINERLWMPEHTAFGQLSLAAQQLTPAANFTGFSPLFAAIPDQDIAEEMYIELKDLGLPLGKEKPAGEIPDLPLAIAFMLYVGLLEYEMHAAAQNLKKHYTLRAQTHNNSLTAQSVCLLWRKY